MGLLAHEQVRGFSWLARPPLLDGDSCAQALAFAPLGVGVCVCRDTEVTIFGSLFLFLMKFGAHLVGLLLCFHDTSLAIYFSLGDVWWCPNRMYLDHNSPEQFLGLSFRLWGKGNKSVSNY